MEENTPTGLAGSITRSPTKEEELAHLGSVIKEFRKSIDALIQTVPKANDFETRENSKIVKTKLIEAKMWSGKMLESLGNPFPAELADKAEVQ